MKSAVDLLEGYYATLEALLREFLLEHSGIEEFEASPGDAVLVIAPNGWRPLTPAGRELQVKLLREHARFAALVSSLLGRSPKDTRERAATLNEEVQSIIDQSGGTWSRSTEDVLAEALTALGEQLDVVKALYDPTPGELVLVVDTNAVIWNPDLEAWAFDDATRFSIVLTSTLLGELDELKMKGRDESVREKAEGAIRRIKEYSRRGDIHSGVTLRRDRSTVRMTAVEPDFEDTLSWLDPTNKDDRLLAAFLEVVREHPHSPVMLVTRDVNLQNKARYAGLAYREPPDPPAVTEEQPRRRRGPQPDVRIFDMKSTGGSSGKITFAALIQNYGGQPVRVTVTASVDGKPVTCWPHIHHLLVNTDPSHVTVEVPGELGELVPPLNNEAIYGQELLLEVFVDDERVATQTWRERIYDSATEPQRHEIQQRYWRMGRGEETEADVRALHLTELARRAESAEDDPPDYEWS